MSVAVSIGLTLVGVAGQARARSPSLDVTLSFIRDTVAEQGLLAYASTTRDAATSQTWDNQFTVEASNVVSNRGDCTVGYHWHSTVDGKPAQDMDSTISFKTVTSVSITSMDDDVARLNAKDGHSAWTTQIRPAVWVLLIHKNNGHTNTIDVRDGDMAERVAKAMRHAAALCGGTTSMPF